MEDDDEVVGEVDVCCSGDECVVEVGVDGGDVDGDDDGCVEDEDGGGD